LLTSLHICRPTGYTVYFHTSSATDRRKI